MAKATLIFIPCTERKRRSVGKGLCASDLPVGTVSSIAAEWGKRLNRSNPSILASKLYCGRPVREADAASKLLGAKLYVISAGLGIVSAESLTQPYSLTVASGRADSIFECITDEDWHPRLWWRALGSNTKCDTALSAFIPPSAKSLVLMSLSQSYAGMLFDELECLSPGRKRRLRIFGLGLENHLPESVRGSWMPYDQRLNGPDSPNSGTLADFGSRALHHFATALKSGRIEGKDPEQDSALVRAIQKAWRLPSTPVRKRLSDDGVIKFINDQWDVVGGRSGGMLRHLRDSGLACEQSRFRDLFRLVAAQRNDQKEKLL